MNAKCDMVLDLGTEEKAQAILRAIEMDNGPYVKADLRGSCLHLSTDAATLGSLLRTVEDLLACIRLAESVNELKP
jgi:tRNA threonylcarbamoyladenosine modification (KEOPS) complex  Pcc1 subunit